MKKDDSYSDFFSWLIPLEVIKLSPTYEFLIKDAREYWREVGRKKGEVQMMSEILRSLVAKRFPKLKITQKIKRIRNAALLQQLVVEAAEIQDAAALRKRLDEAIKSQKS